MSQTDWTIATSQAHILALLAERSRQYDERFAAQERAVVVALAGVDKGFTEHLRSYKVETDLALNAAEKAILKSEAATDRRFEAANNFRDQLLDQANTFIPRVETEQRINVLAERLTTLDVRVNEALARVHSRLDLNEGRSGGFSQSWAFLIAAVGLIGTVVFVVLALKG